MGQAAERIRLLLYGLLLLLLFFGLIEVFIDGGRKFLLLEMLGLLFLVLLSLIAFIGYRSWGKRVLMAVFLLYILNLILIWAVKGKLYIMLLLLAVIGFFLSIFAEMPKPQPPSKAKEEPHSMVFEPAASVPKKTEPVKTFSPGRFVASSQSNQFHAPTCDWAKKIQKARQVWFQDQDDAFEKGYRKHSCLK